MSLPGRLTDMEFPTSKIPWVVAVISPREGYKGNRMDSVTASCTTANSFNNTKYTKY